MMNLKGNSETQCPYQQFIANKRVKFGIQFHKLCETKSSYCAYFKIDVGQYNRSGAKNPVSEDVVMDICI